MKPSHILLSAIVLVAALFTSCSKNSSGSNAANAVKFQLQTTNRTSILARVQAGSIQWTSGFGNTTEVKFEAKINSQEIERKSQAAQKVDLFAAINTLGNITLAPGTYNEVEFKVELNPSGSEGSLELNGQFTRGGVTTPVAFKIAVPVELKNEKSNVVVTDNSTYKAITTIDLSLITKGITESMLNSAVKTNGTILISSAVNSNIYNILVSNLHDSDEVEFEHD